MNKFKIQNCSVAIVLLLLTFTLGFIVAKPETNKAPDEYIEAGDFVVLLDNEPKDRKADRTEEGFNTPNGWPKIGERVKVLDVLNNGRGLEIEGYPTYFQNSKTGFAIFRFKKVP